MFLSSWQDHLNKDVLRSEAALVQILLNSYQGGLAPLSSLIRKPNKIKYTKVKKIYISRRVLSHTLSLVTSKYSCLHPSDSISQNAGIWYEERTAWAGEMPPHCRMKLSRELRAFREVAVDVHGQWQLFLELACTFLVAFKGSFLPFLIALVHIQTEG